MKSNKLATLNMAEVVIRGPFAENFRSELGRKPILRLAVEFI
jgi:hypothetical protein